MSAWIVSKEHIDYLLSAALECGTYAPQWAGEQIRDLARDDGLTMDDIGQALWTENTLSVSHRYEPEMAADLGVLETVGYLFCRTSVDVTTAIKQAHCYRYQACEHPEWETSESAAFIEDLIDSLTHRLPGYDAAPWGIEPMDVS